MRGGRRRVDASQAGIVSALRDAGASVWLTYHLGHGSPDAVVWYAGRVYLLEIKSGDGGLTEDEERFHTTWRGPIPVVRTPAEALAVIGVTEEGER